MASLSWFGSLVSSKAAEVNQHPTINKITSTISEETTKARESEAWTKLSTAVIAVGDQIATGTVNGVNTIKTNTGPVIETIGAKSREAFTSVKENAGPAVASARTSIAKGMEDGKRAVADARIGEKFADLKTKVVGSGNGNGNASAPVDIRPPDASI
jgi:hypothetical protein